MVVIMELAREQKWGFDDEEGCRRTIDIWEREMGADCSKHFANHGWF